MISIPSPPPSHALSPWRPAPFLPPGRSPKSLSPHDQDRAARETSLVQNCAQRSEPGDHGVANGDQEGQGEGEGDPPSHGVSPRPPPPPLPASRFRRARSIPSGYSRLLASLPPVSSGGFVSSLDLTDARVSVCLGHPRFLPSCSPASGLDNAGKTTIVKNVCGEDVSKTSPTLGFEIKTLAHNG